MTAARQADDQVTDDQVTNGQVTADPTAPLSERLRAGTAQDHARAESRDFARDLLSGELGAPGWSALLGQLHHVYGALERAGERVAALPGGRSLVDDDLRRVPAIEHDLGVLGAAVPAPLAATSRYVARLGDVADDVALWAAHAWTRYLGDLAGGQAIRVAMARAGVPGEALTFYDFSAVGRSKPYRDAWRARLDALPLDAGHQDDVVAEARTAFALNADLFDDLAGAVSAAGAPRG